MRCPPAIERELRVAAGRAGTYWIRALIAGIAILAALRWFDNWNTLNPSYVGRGVFGMVAAIGMVLATAACFITADSISHERREGTLGLLFLTSLKSRDIIAGKLAAQGLGTLYYMLGLAPALMLSVVAGGVTGGDVFRMVVWLLDMLFLSLAAGLLASVLSWSQPAAILKALLILTLVTLVPFGAGQFLGLWLPNGLAACSPVFAGLTASDTAYAKQPSAFWISIAATLVAGWVMLAGAATALQKNWRHVHLSRALRPEPVKSRRLLGTPRVVLAHRANRRRAFAPVARAVLRLRGQRPLIWLAALTCFAGSLITVIMLRQLGSAAVAASFGMVFDWVGLALFALVAGRFFMEARRTGELELLLVTPVGTRGILREQRLALLRLLSGPIYLVLTGALLLGATRFLNNPDATLRTFVSSGTDIAISALDVLTIVRVAMGLGARARNYFTLMGSTIGLVILLPNLLVMLTGVFIALAGVEAETWPAASGVLLVIKDLCFLWWAGRRLRRDFRTTDRSVFDRFFGWCERAAFGRLKGT